MQIYRWNKINDELAFLTEGTERRALEHLDARLRGDRVMSLEQISRLDKDKAFAEERDVDLEAISKSVTDVAQIFKELAILVIDQGTVFDRCVRTCFSS